MRRRQHPAAAPASNGMVCTLEFDHVRALPTPRPARLLPGGAAPPGRAQVDCHRHAAAGARRAGRCLPNARGRAAVLFEPQLPPSLLHTHHPSIHSSSRPHFTSVQSSKRPTTPALPQNRVGELFALMCFLGVEPLNDRWAPGGSTALASEPFRLPLPAHGRRLYSPVRPRPARAPATHHTRPCPRLLRFNPAPERARPPSRSFWRRLLERPLRNRDERGLMRLQVGWGAGFPRPQLLGASPHHRLTASRPQLSSEPHRPPRQPPPRNHTNVRVQTHKTHKHTICPQILMGALALRRTKATQGRSGRPLVTLTRKTTLLLEARARALVGRGLALGDRWRPWSEKQRPANRVAFCRDPFQTRRRSCRPLTGPVTGAITALPPRWTWGARTRPSTRCLSGSRAPWWGARWRAAATKRWQSTPAYWQSSCGCGRWGGLTRGVCARV